MQDLKNSSKITKVVLTTLMNPISKPWFTLKTLIQRSKFLFTYPPSFFRIIDLTAKENAYDDCMAALKKAYEKDMLNLQEYLQLVRKLSGKQFKSTLKRNKIIQALSKQ